VGVCFPCGSKTQVLLVLLPRIGPKKSSLFNSPSGSQEKGRVRREPALSLLGKFQCMWLAGRLTLKIGGGTAARVQRAARP
jgi:hypothetical protein